VKKLLTCEQVAERYGISVETVWEWVRNGKLPAIAISTRRYRIRPEDLEAFERQSETKAVTS